MNYLSDNLNLPEVKQETELERRVNDLIEGWHFKYNGPLELNEFLAEQMDWTLMQANAWLSGKGF